MTVAQRARSVACTAMNAQSSRSHSVFTLWLSGTDNATATTLKVSPLVRLRYSFLDVVVESCARARVNHSSFEVLSSIALPGTFFGTAGGKRKLGEAMGPDTHVHVPS